MEQPHYKTGIVNWVVLLAVAAVSIPLARHAESGAGLVASALLGLGFLVAAASQLQMRLGEREDLERIEFEELRKARGEAALFAEADTFPARHSREQFERFVIPALAVVLLALQAAGAWWFWRRAGSAPAPSVDRATLAMAFYALFGIALFLLGQISSNLARLASQRLLRPGAGYLMLGSLACFVVAGVEAAAWFGFPKADLWATRIFSVLLGLVAAETLINLVLEIYRPRVKGQPVHLLYESRLIGLFGQPAGIITTAAQALDYQFGFKVSETWFYLFLERALSWIILLQLGVLCLFTTVVIVEPDEQALLERFGQPVVGREVLGPGLHLKWPWPIDEIYRYPTRRIQNFIVGVVPDPDLERERTVLWTRPHYKEEFNMLVASRDNVPVSGATSTEKPVPANLLAASIPVHYEITNLTQWAYRHANPGRLLEHLANAEVVRYLANVDFDSVMSVERQAAGEILRERIQAAANNLELGTRIVYIGLENIHPPIGNKQQAVAASFEQVIGAKQQADTNRLYALAYEAGRIPLAQADSLSEVADALNARTNTVATAQAESVRFQKQNIAYRASTNAYMQRVYLDALARAVAPVRKYVIAATNTSDVVILNLEEKVRSDLGSSVILPPDAVKNDAAKK